MKHQVDFLELLQIDYEKYPVIAVVGGGGKTSLIYRLADELLDLFDDLRHVSRVARAVREEDAVRVHGEHFLCRRVRESIRCGSGKRTSGQRKICDCCGI